MQPPLATSIATQFTSFCCLRVKSHRDQARPRNNQDLDDDDDDDDDDDGEFDISDDEGYGI
jgi:hypothetical protein